MLTFELASDLYLAGHTPEEGTDVIGESFYVVAIDELGRRWAHNHRFCTTTKVVDDETEFGYYFSVVFRDEVKERAERLLGRIIAAGKINSEHWVEINPVYGSEAYILSNEELELIELEKHWYEFA